MNVRSCLTGDLGYTAECRGLRVSGVSRSRLHYGHFRSVLVCTTAAVNSGMADDPVAAERGVLTAPAEAWDLAVRRTEVIRELAAQRVVSLEAADAAAAQLGVSRRQVYVLVGRWRAGEGVASPRWIAVRHAPALPHNFVVSTLANRQHRSRPAAKRKRDAHVQRGEHWLGLAGGKGSPVSPPEFHHVSHHVDICPVQIRPDPPMVGPDIKADLPSSSLGLPAARAGTEVGQIEPVRDDPLKPSRSRRRWTIPRRCPATPRATARRPPAGSAAK